MVHEGFKLVMPGRGVHALTERIAAERNLFLVTHTGLAEVEPASWWLDVDGLVGQQSRLALRDFGALPRAEVTSVHECVGNPLAPREPERGAGNLAWSGVPLAAVLDRADLPGDGGAAWHQAKLEAGTGFTWQRLAWTWTPFAPCRHRLVCRCHGAAGQGQADEGARNAVHAVDLEVAG